MADRVFLLHGWSVASTTTYRGLDRALTSAGFAPSEIRLGHYVSLDDNVTIGDLANALDRAIAPLLPESGEYHFVTHSTGALIVRDWLRRHYARQAGGPRLGNAVFLAGPHFGSRLAHAGRSLLAKLKWLGDTGDEILHDLELGSALQWSLAEHLTATGAHLKGGHARMFAIAGDSSDRNSFAGRVFPASIEVGSDGVARTASANPNAMIVRVDVAHTGATWRATHTIAGKELRIPFRVLPQYHHTDSDENDNLGIIRSITTRSRIAPRSPDYHEALATIVRCLRVRSIGEQRALASRFARQNAALFGPSGENDRKKVPDPGPTPAPGVLRPAFSQLVFRFRTDAGDPITDYRVEMIAHTTQGPKPTKTVAHVHPNRWHRHVTTFFIDHREFEPQFDYSFAFFAKSGSRLVRDIDAEIKPIGGSRLLSVVDPHRTTLFDVVIRREPIVQTEPGGDGLLGFTPSDEDGGLLHFEFDRSGRATRRGLGRDEI